MLYSGKENIKIKTKEELNWVLNTTEKARKNK